MFSTTLWGEADCFIQYHFPSIQEGGEEEGEEEEADEEYTGMVEF